MTDYSRYVQLTSTTGTSVGDGLSGSQEETGTNGTGDGNHNHVSETKITLQTDLLGSHVGAFGSDVVHLVDLILLVTSFVFRHCW